MSLKFFVIRRLLNNNYSINYIIRTCNWYHGIAILSCRQKIPTPFSNYHLCTPKNVKKKFTTNN